MLFYPGLIVGACLSPGAASGSVARRTGRPTELRRAVKAEVGRLTAQRAVLLSLASASLYASTASARRVCFAASVHAEGYRAVLGLISAAPTRLRQRCRRDSLNKKHGS